jgi:hypothetical protein
MIGVGGKSFAVMALGKIKTALAMIGRGQCKKVFGRHDVKRDYVT